jgi:hypothetical protein
MSDQSGQSHRPSVDQGHAPPPAENSKNRVSPDDAEIAPNCQFQSTRHAVALNCSDDGLVQVHSCRTHRTTAARDLVANHGGIELADRRQVVAGAERRSDATQNGDLLFIILGEGTKSIAQFFGCLAVNTVANFRPIEQNDRHRTILIHHNLTVFTHPQLPIPRDAEFTPS